MEKVQPIGTQVEGDRYLLNFTTYEEYLDSLVTPQDLYYLQSTDVARTLAELGYRSTGVTLTREAFYLRLAAVREYMFPSRKPYVLVSVGMPATDALQQELGLRERSNRVGLLATIIFLRHFTKTGFEVSGYIDFAHRLKLDDWTPFFEGKRRLWPRPEDLGYYHWKIGTSSCKSSLNYKVIIDPYRGLMFQNRQDRKIINVDPNEKTPGSNTTRVRVFTDNYEQVVLYDHVVRRRC